MIYVENSSMKIFRIGIRMNLRRDIDFLIARIAGRARNFAEKIPKIGSRSGSSSPREMTLPPLSKSADSAVVPTGAPNGARSLLLKAAAFCKRAR
jgi:hypothetical protein